MAEETTATVEENEEVDTNTNNDDEALRPEGVKALNEWKKRAKEAEKEAKRAKELEAQLAQFEEANKSEQDKLLEKARKEAAEQARNEVMSEVQREKLETQVLKQALGKLNDPDDAIKFLDLDELQDEAPEAISSAIEELVTSKPYLAASATRPTGSADQGVRKTTEGLAQLTRADLARMTPQQISEAQEKGQLNDLLGRK